MTTLLVLLVKTSNIVCSHDNARHYWKRRCKKKRKKRNTFTVVEGRHFVQITGLSKCQWTSFSARVNWSSLSPAAAGFCCWLGSWWPHGGTCEGSCVGRPVGRLLGRVWGRLWDWPGARAPVWVAGSERAELHEGGWVWSVCGESSSAGGWPSASAPPLNWPTEAALWPWTCRSLLCTVVCPPPCSPGGPCGT